MDELFSAIDAGEVSGEEFTQALLRTVGTDVAESVDRRLGKLRFLTGGSFVLKKPKKNDRGEILEPEKEYTTGELGAAYNQLDKIQRRIRVLESGLEGLKQNTIEVMQYAKHDALAGSYGGFKLVENPPSLEITIPNYKAKSKSISNVIDPADMEFYNLPGKYVIQTLTHSINCERLKEDMLAGGEGWGWAKIVKKTNIKTV